MPDIDTDFDDEGRQKVIDYVVEKYGKMQVASIVTYGTMAAKTSIKDVARVMELPLELSNGLTKLVPDKPGISLNRILHAPLDGENSLKDKEGLTTDDIQQATELRKILQDKTDERSKILEEAKLLEGSVRGTGVHAAGIIIAPSDLTELIPMATAKDSELLLTQFEGKVIEQAGALKMDFLGLKTLTIIKNSLNLIKKNHGVEINIDEVDLNDSKTLELFQKGNTDGIFQFENPGLQKFLRELKPDKLEDLIAMTALHRPGPMQYVSSYIKRKNGQEKVTFDLPEMEEHLSETYGITVYQEQVMLLSQKLADFSKASADYLRKAMGKKNKQELDNMKALFMENAQKKGHPLEKLEKIWKDWEAFAEYAFNKSHATCYAYVAFQLAWLKAHYPSEFLAANLTNEKDNIEKLAYFLEECKRMGIKVLGPDVNESSVDFDVNKKGEIRFGLGAIKGTGEAATISVIEERNRGGLFQDIYDFAGRNNLRTVNRRTFEAFANAGAFDCFTEMHRAQFFSEREGQSFLEKLLRYGNHVQEQKNSSEITLFGEMGKSMSIAKPAIFDCPKWENLVRLRIEKEVLGLYISGHPLDQYHLELKLFTTCTLDNVMKQKKGEIQIGGMVSNVNERISKNGDRFAILTLEDFIGKFEFVIWTKDYPKFAAYCKPESFLYIRGNLAPRYGKPDELEFKPFDFKLLSEIRETFCQGILLEVPISKLSPEFTEKLEKSIAKNTGKSELKLLIYEPSENISFEMFSRKYNVNPSNDFLEELEKMELRFTLKNQLKNKTANQPATQNRNF